MKSSMQKATKSTIRIIIGTIANVAISIDEAQLYIINIK